MHPALIVQNGVLEDALSEWEYLQIIWEEYQEVWRRAPDKILENFDDEQLSFLIYGILLNQVENGGFLQLIFNGYTGYVFASPLAQSLEEWGASELSVLLVEIEQDALLVHNAISENDSAPFTLAESYALYPQFKEYDIRFTQNNGVSEVKEYVEANLSKFIQVI